MNTQVSGQTVNGPAADFDALVEEYYQAWFRFHPEAAVDCGVQGYEHLLQPFSDDDIGALIALNEKLLAGLDEINSDYLDADRKIDYQVLRGSVLIEHHELLEQDWRLRDPAHYLPVNAIYQLTIRPVESFDEAIQARLSAIPAHLRNAKGRLAELSELIPEIWLESAVIEATEGASFIRNLYHNPRVSRLVAKHNSVSRLIEEAAHSLEEYSHFLETDLASEATGTFACGREHFERILKYRHFLDIDADALYQFGQQLYETTLDELKSVTREIRDDEDIAAMLEKIHQDHPAAGDLRQIYTEEMEAAFNFVRSNDLVSIPEKQNLYVVDTPEFLRHQIPFAAYMDPVPNDPEQNAYYYVTPAASNEMLGEHSYPSIRLVCTHEAWPGHHLQFVTANQRPESRTLPRLLNPSAALYEGWALYCEQMMQEQGFLDRPEQKFLRLRDRLWRAMRIMLDVELHVRGLGIDEAAKRMNESLGFPLEQAKADLLWYTKAPGVPMGYATGWALITNTREKLQENEADFSLKSFHDRLLSSGSVALPLVLQRQFGEPVWGDIRQSVFGQ